MCVCVKTRSVPGQMLDEREKTNFVTMEEESKEDKLFTPRSSCQNFVMGEVGTALGLKKAMQTQKLQTTETTNPLQIPQTSREKETVTTTFFIKSLIDGRPDRWRELCYL